MLLISRNVYWRDEQRNEEMAEGNMMFKKIIGGGAILGYYIRIEKNSCILRINKWKLTICWWEGENTTKVVMNALKQPWHKNSNISSLFERCRHTGGDSGKLK